MAQIIPSDFSRMALAGAHSPELETLRELKVRLPAAYTVFHGIHWSREYAGSVVFGEADFVIVNQAGRVLVVEQKSGALQETEAGLAKQYPGRTKLVGDQVRRSLEGIREKFKGLHPRERGLDLDYLVYCPDYKVLRVNAAALDPSRLVDAPSRARLAQRIEAILGPGTPGAEPWAETVMAFFRQTFEVVPDIHAHISSQEKAFTRLSGGLVTLLAGLEMAPLRLRVHGTAGCGKSLIAQQAPAVILVDVESDPGRPDLSARLLYAGMTRATVRLELLVKADDPLGRRLQSG